MAVRGGFGCQTVVREFASTAGAGCLTGVFRPDSVSMHRRGGHQMSAGSGRSVRDGPSRGIPSSRFRSRKPSPKPVAKPSLESLFKDRPSGAGQAGDACPQNLELRLEGRRLGRLRGGTLRITCGCGHSGDVPVAALVARHGEDARVRDAVDSMRCSGCGARRVQEVRWLS